MKRVCLLLAVLAACLLSCSKGGRTIPAGKLADIYVDMLILDQWAKNNTASSRQADTSLVYEPIIRRHGYTVDEYIRTVEGYLQKPGEFAKVFENVRHTLQARADFLTAIEDQKNREQNRRDSVDARTDYRKARIFTITGDPTLAVRIDLDSVGIYNLERLRPDTLYEGLFFYLRDSVSTDSLSRDSLLVDSVRVDSVLTDSLKTPADSAKVSGQPAAKAAPASPAETAASRPRRPAPVKKTLKKENEAYIREIPVSAE